MSVPNWTPHGRLMHFPFLDGSGSTVPVYTIGWRILYGADDWTARFLRFKAGSRRDVEAGAMLLKDAIDELLISLRYDRSETGLTTALSSNSTEPDPRSVLYTVGAWLSVQLGITWFPDILRKTAHRSLHSLSSSVARDAEVANKYTCVSDPGVSNLLLLDDFVTRGTTFAEIHRAITAVNSDINIIGISLAKNENASFASQFGVKVDNTHIPAEWDEIWGNA